MALVLPRVYKKALATQTFTLPNSWLDGGTSRAQKAMLHTQLAASFLYHKGFLTRVRKGKRGGGGGGCMVSICLAKCPVAQDSLLEKQVFWPAFDPFRSERRKSQAPRGFGPQRHCRSLKCTQNLFKGSVFQQLRCFGTPFRKRTILGRICPSNGSKLETLDVRSGVETTLAHAGPRKDWDTDAVRGQRYKIGGSKVS